MKTVTLPDFLTEKQIKAAQNCKSAREISEKVITPNLKAINKKLGQENDAMYLAYCCEYAFRESGLWPATGETR